MILPTLRASFGRDEALHLVDLLGRDDPDTRERARARLERDGIDALLDDPRILNALLTDPDVGAPPRVVFYVLVRHALLEGGIPDPLTADYIASLMLRFGHGSRAYRVSDSREEEYRYLVDLVAEMREADSQKAFPFWCHLGNYSLWLSGLFPDHLEWRVNRKGAPPIDYYEKMGSTGFRLAAGSTQAEALGVALLFQRVARDFRPLRTALNRLSDRYLWPSSGNPVNRLLREVRHMLPEE
jgi:hypothetical protein